jgi:hypothetical protein
VTVSVTQPDFRARRDLFGPEKFPHGCDKRVRLFGLIDRRWISAAFFILYGEIDSDNSPEPWQKIW